MSRFHNKLQPQLQRIGMTLGCKIPAITYRTLSKTWLRTAVSLSYKVIGEGSSEPEEPPIFLLHGLLGCKKHWKGIGKTILNMTKRSVVIVDQRNHGGSPHVSSHKYEEMAADFVQLLDKLDVDKASLVGHSMGGRTAMCVSLIAPKRVAGILIVDISPVSTAEQLLELQNLLVAMKAIDFKRSKKVSRAKKEAKKQLKKLIPDDITMNAVLSNINVKNDGTIGWICNLDILIKHFKYIASFPSSMHGKTYDGPTMFIGGQLSDYIPADDLTHIRELFPQAVITYIQSTGHNLHAEDPRSFLELAIAFLRTNH